MGHYRKHDGETTGRGGGTGGEKVLGSTNKGSSVIQSCARKTSREDKRS